MSEIVGGSLAKRLIANWARGCGAYGMKVSKPGGVRGAIADALAHDGPALVDVDVNPNEPPMPGKVKYEQAKHFTEPFQCGQPHKVAIAATAVRGKINELRS